MLVLPLLFSLYQPDGTMIPSPELYCNSGSPGGLAAIFACQCVDPGVCNIGVACPGDWTPPCDDGINSTCETTVWHNYNDNSCVPENISGLDPTDAAADVPETFSPTCPLTFNVVSRGSAIFHNVFGWYNVTGARPANSDLHVMVACNAAAGTSTILDIKSEPSYLGGEIGFFMITPESHTTHQTCDGGDCCATLARYEAGVGYAYFSEKEYNDDHVASGSFIHLITYDSRVWENKFYFAWEDMYSGLNNDFSDFVTSVAGVQCAGGGVSCDTGADGICSYGVTRCEGGSLSCVQLYTGEAERCDGLDNNCDGDVDNGATCPSADEICSNGRCVPDCNVVAEFSCPPDLECGSDGVCYDPLCAGVDCPEGKTCRGGTCYGDCEGIVCPYGQVCRQNSCFDPCDGILCGDGEVCSEGLCINDCASCNGMTCGSPLTCDTTSRTCVNLSCASPCPDGTHCSAGSCVDNCAGTVCPYGQICKTSECVNPGPGEHIDAGVTTGPDAGTTTGPDSGFPDDGGGDGGCGCAKASAAPTAGRATGTLLLVAICLAGLGGTRRRKK
jgi:hypothetical protein